MIGIRRVVGDSMEPFLSAGRLIVVVSSKHYNPGDVVGVRFDSKIIIKRIAKTRDNLVYVLGDNPRNSLDSRKLGWIASDNLVFKLLFRF